MADPVTALGWVTSSIIPELVKKCSAHLDFGASEKLLQLEPKVLLLQQATEAVEIIPHKGRLGPLLERLKSAFYEAEDILDDVEYHCLEKQIQDDKSKSNGSTPPRKRDWLKKKFPFKISSPLKNKETGTPNKKLKDSLEKIEKVINEAHQILEQLKFSSRSNGNESSAKLGTTSAAPQLVTGRDKDRDQNEKRAKLGTTSAAPQLVTGRDKDRDQIIEMLHEKEDGGQPNTNIDLCYSVIGIHGIAGSGKSTLARLVYACEEKDKEEKKDGHFDLVMWVHVSQNFSMDTIFREMLEEATGNPCPEFRSLNTLEKSLRNELSGKRILLVLDDVWYDKHVSQELQQILSPLVVAKAGSKILVTSRTEQALLALGAAKSGCIPIRDLDDDVFFNLFMHYALRGVVIDDPDRRRLEVIGADIANKLKGSPLAACTVGGRLRMEPKVEFWRRVKNGKLFNDTMGALWWSYQHLDQQARRCFAYCSIFPRRHHLYRDQLVKLWVAEGFIRSSNEWKEMDDVGREYFDELVSASFLQPGGKDMWNKDYYLVHDLLHDLAETVAGSDCFRIENERSQSGEVWEGDVPQGVRHLFLQNYDGELITNKILALKNLNLRTLIIYNVGWDTPVEENVIESIFKRLRKLRVLAIALSQIIEEPKMLSVPESISQLKHLRYLAFRTCPSCRVILPSTLTKLYHIQLLDFGYCKELEFSSADLINLRHVSSYSGPNFSNIGRLTSLKTVSPFFAVRNEQGYEVKQLRDLNKLCGNLQIRGLENVKSKEEALEANLAAKKQLTELTLSWNGDTRCSPEVEAEVLEGLCPPMGLEYLDILHYKGSRYPNWMVRKQNNGPNDLQELFFHGWSQLGPAPELEAFIHLRSLEILCCSWDTLPGNMEQLTSLKRLLIRGCSNIRSLPTLPQSLEEFKLVSCNAKFMQSCQTVGHQNWRKIEHIPTKKWTV